MLRHTPVHIAHESTEKINLYKNLRPPIFFYLYNISVETSIKTSAIDNEDFSGGFIYNFSQFCNTKNFHYNLHYTMFSL